MAVELRGMAGISADTSSATPVLRTANDSAMKDDPPRDSPFIRPRLARGFLMRNRVVRQFSIGDQEELRRRVSYFLAARYRITRTFSSVIRPPSTMPSKRGRI